MRSLFIAMMAAAALAGTSCSGSTPSTPSMTAPSTTATMNGSWVGTTSDSTGSMMGAGLTAAMMNNASWTIVQTDNTFTGTMRFGGYMGGAIGIAGVMNGRSGTFTMTMSPGSMMAGMCTATASGTFDMDDTMTSLHGAYTGTNSCIGAFDRGQVVMHR